MDRDEIRSDLLDHGLARVADQLAGLALPCIGLESKATKDDEIPLGASKFGGQPDLPEDVSWPSWNDQPLAFLCQINLASASKLDTDKLLPATGLLSFFYVADQSTWGFDPQDRGSWSVQYFADAELKRTPWPEDLDEEAYYTTCKLEYKRRATIPGWETKMVDDLKLSEDEQEKFFDFTEAFTDEDDPFHHLLGHPQEIQGAMQLECQLASNGLYCGDATGYNDPLAEALKSGQSDWRLLMQIDSDENADWMWGDVGRLYFWMTSDDLNARNFSNCWMILQCG